MKPKIRVFKNAGPFGSSFGALPHQSQASQFFWSRRLLQSAASLGSQGSIMKPEDRYHRFVRWSDEDQCYIGYCPDLYYGGCCHGNREEDTYANLCAIVREEITYRSAKGEPLPEPAVRDTRDLDFPA